MKNVKERSQMGHQLSKVRMALPIRFILSCVSAVALSACVAGGIASPSDEVALQQLLVPGAVTAKTEVIGKGRQFNSSCKGALCSAFGVESVSSDVMIDHIVDVKLDAAFATEEILSLMKRGRPIYVAVDQRMSMKVRRGGNTTVEDQTIRRAGATACANEPYMFVLAPENGYWIREQGQAEVTIKRTYAPGSAVRDFEIVGVDGANSPILKMSLSPFKVGKQDCWHPAFKNYRP